MALTDTTKPPQPGIMVTQGRSWSGARDTARGMRILVAVTTTPPLDPQQVDKKWREIAPLIDRLIERVAEEKEFRVKPGSALCGDDRHASPYHVSHAFRQCFNAAVDHLHAAKLLVFDLRVIHVAATASLARSAIENAATAYWILEPPRRDARIMRALRWQSRNIRDQHFAVAHLSPTPLDAQLSQVAAVAAARGLNTHEATSGYKQSTVMAEVARDTGLNVDFVWQMCSGFAHGRPWAYLGALDQERTPTGDPDIFNVKLTSDPTRALYPILNALHLIQEVLRLWEPRAGYHRPSR
jgi:hypothetical protein